MWISIKIEEKCAICLEIADLRSHPSKTKEKQSWRDNFYFGITNIPEID